MKCYVNFKRLDHSQALVDYANERLRRLEKYEWKPVSVHLTLSRQKHMIMAEMSAVVSDATFHSSVKAADYVGAVDQVVEKLGRQLVKKKKKIQYRKGRTALNETLVSLTPMGEDDFLEGDWGDTFVKRAG
jgi:putative sigma-54 modulation protein